MLLIGLTGSIATGKSTCSNILSSPPQSLPIIDADLLARRAVEPGTWAYRRIVNTFLPSTPDLLLPTSDPACDGHENGKDGRGRPLNRPALGRRVFGAGEERTKDRQKLNGIVHPAVRFYMAREVLWYFIRGHWAVVLDIPLLFESGLDVFVGTVVVVAVKDPRVQMQRLRDRDSHLSEEDAGNRVKSQVDVREKAERALRRNAKEKHLQKDESKTRGFVVYNDGTKQDLQVQIRDVMRRIEARSPRWWSWLLLVCPPLVMSVAVKEMFVNWWSRRQARNERGEELPKPKL